MILVPLSRPIILYYTILQAAVTTMDAMTELVYELDGSTLEKFFMAGESKVCNFSDKCLFQKLQKLFG